MGVITTDIRDRNAQSPCPGHKRQGERESGAFKPGESRARGAGQPERSNTQAAALCSRSDVKVTVFCVLSFARGQFRRAEPRRGHTSKGFRPRHKRLSGRGFLPELRVSTPLCVWPLVGQQGPDLGLEGIDLIAELLAPSLRRRKLGIDRVNPRTALPIGWAVVAKAHDQVDKAGLFAF